MSSKLVQVVVYIPYDQLQKIDQQVQQEGSGRSSWIRQACEEKIERNEKRRVVRR